MQFVDSRSALMYCEQLPQKGFLSKADPNLTLLTRGRYRGLSLTGQSGIGILHGNPFWTTAKHIVEAERYSYGLTVCNGALIIFIVFYITGNL